MLSNIKNRKEKGFTIIEVLIVLAIAGLILLVVFLAVPALQRNARNTSRTNDVAALLGGISEFVNNNNGNLPDTIATTAGNAIELRATSGGNSVPVTLGFYVPANVTIDTTATTNDTTTDTVKLRKTAKCNPDSVGQPLTSGVSSRSIAALFTSEPNAKRCSES